MSRDQTQAMGRCPSTFLLEELLRLDHINERRAAGTVALSSLGDARLLSTLTLVRAMRWASSGTHTMM